MSLVFKKTVEDFTCLHCGARVVGNGYTNHCPRCLWGQHVDIHPGDRQNPCGGPLAPVAVVLKGRGYIITHQCQVCGEEKQNRAATNDDIAGFLATMI